MQERIDRRYRNSGGQEADFSKQVGSGPTRLFHNSHNSANVRQHGPDAKGEGNILGERRGSANPKGEI
jgi:hypothetical protein